MEQEVSLLYFPEELKWFSIIIGDNLFMLFVVQALHDNNANVSSLLVFNKTKHQVDCSKTCE